jgi:hypothetical protein
MPFKIPFKILFSCGPIWHSSTLYKYLILVFLRARILKDNISFGNDIIIYKLSQLSLFIPFVYPVQPVLVPVSPGCLCLPSEIHGNEERNGFHKGGS